MQNLRLLELLESVLGPSRKKSKGNSAFNCPFPDCKHTDYKLEINLQTSDTNKWHCWRCDRKGTKLPFLFKQLAVSEQKSTELYKLLGYGNQSTVVESKPSTKLYLPDEYRPLWNKYPGYEYKNAIHYALRIRKLTPIDIIRHQIGYAETGKYAKKLIIPSYDNNGELNFYTANLHLVKIVLR